MMEVGKTPNPGSTSLARYVTDVLHHLGVPAHLKGHCYLRDAIIMTIQMPAAVTYITKSIYPDIAKRYFTTVSRVERAMRHALEVAWDRRVMNPSLAEEFHFSDVKPSNSEFVSIVSTWIRSMYYNSER